MGDLPRLEVASARAWRGWLERHHASSAGVWLALRKGAPAGGLRYAEALDEALCFGWIDSVMRREDDRTYVQKFTPRRDRAKWSEANRVHARRLIAAGRMTPAGLAAIGVPLDQPGPAGPTTAAAEAGRGPAPAWFTDALAARPRAAEFFARLSPSCRRRYLAWLADAKREETRARRLAEALDLLERGVKDLMK